METIRVNMTPCEDVQTIHASQNDNEARQWEFELHNNGELIDTSEVTDQIVFKAYKGGTEQILPENTSTPTTSPFKGDIKYPQGLLTDQEFLYRESPTEEDGLAKITDIKGNTLVWNQLMENGNFADTSKWSAESGATLSISNNIATISSTTANNGIRQYFSNPLTVNHKYLVKAEFNVPLECRCVVGTAGSQGVQIEKLVSTPNTWTEVIGIGTCTIATTTFYCFVRGTTYENVKVRNVMCFDLTQMGLDISNPSDFTSLFSLPYYSYNQGTLLSFNGTGLKSVGKNLLNYLNNRTASDITFTYDQSSGAYKVEGTLSLSDAWSDVGIDGTVVQNYPRLRKGTYKVSGFNSTILGRIQAWYDDGTNEVIIATIDSTMLFTLNQDAYVYIRGHVTGQGTSFNETIYPMITFADADQTFEPYTSSTLSLPISTYFPNGMNGHGDTYDELTSAVATKSFEKNSLGDLNWTRRTTNIFSANLPSEFDASKDISCFMSNRLPTVFVSGYTLAEDGYISIYKTTTVTSSTSIYLNVASQSIDTVADLQTWLSNNPTELVYPLATPTETEITTASLVTENAEIPLSNEDGVLIGKCNSDVSANAGFIEGKIKLSDSDGDVYSNKIQIHVERSPQ